MGSPAPPPEERHNIHFMCCACKDTRMNETAMLASGGYWCKVCWQDRRRIEDSYTSLYSRVLAIEEYIESEKQRRGKKRKHNRKIAIEKLH